MNSAISGMGDPSSMLYNSATRPSSAQPPDTAALAKNMVEALDSDRNGSLSQSELQGAVDQMASASRVTQQAVNSTPDVSEVFNSLDENGDSAVSDTEIATTLETLANSRGGMEGFNSGAQDATGAPPGGGPGGPGVPPPPVNEPSSGTSAATDSNDYGLSEEELQVADTNGDGQVSQSEMQAYQQLQSSDSAGATDARADTASSGSGADSEQAAGAGMDRRTEQQIMQLARTYGAASEQGAGDTITSGGLFSMAA